MSAGPEWNAASVYADAQKTTFDAWALCLRRKWLILFMLAVFLGLGWLYYSKATPVYETVSQMLMVDQRQGAEMPVQSLDPQTSVADKIETQIFVIDSPRIIGRAVVEHNLGELESLRSYATPGAVVNAIRSDLEVYRAGGKDVLNADVLELSYRSTVPEDATTIITSIIDAYQDYLAETYQSINERTLAEITRMKDDAMQELAKSEKAFADFQETSPLLSHEPEQQTVPQARLMEIQSELSGVMVNRAEIKARIEAIETALSQGANRDALILMVDQMQEARAQRPNAAVQDMEDYLFPILLEMEMAKAEFGPEHPKVKAFERQIQITTDYLQSREISRNQGETGRSTADFLSLYIESLRRELDDLALHERELNAMADTELAQARHLKGYLIEAAKHRAVLERDQQIFENVMKYWQELNLAHEQGTLKADVIDPSVTAWQVEPNIYKVMGGATFLGLLIGFLLAYMVDTADKSFRSPEEVRHELGVPILGHVPVIVTDRASRAKKGEEPKSKVDPIVCTFHRPKSTNAEAYRAVRTALNFGTRGEGHKIIQITSPDPGDGKTTLSTNLAACIAQSGKRVLLIDADFRRPRVHKVFGSGGEIGLADVMTGDVELHDAISDTEMDNLWVLPCGSRPPNPSELLSQPRFVELLELLREQFDIVLIDTPPVLAVTDPCVVAPRVDGIVLLIRVTKYARPHAKRSVEMLESLGANLLGLVINGVGGQRPSLGYGFGGQYGYRYAQSGYYDAISYGETQYVHYYSDDEETPARSNGSAESPLTETAEK